MVGNTSFMVPRMGVQRYLPRLIKAGIDYVKLSNKHFNSQRLDAFSYFVDSLAKRLHSLSVKHMMLNDLRRYLCIEYLQLNLEKQMIALRFLLELFEYFCEKGGY